MVPNILSSTERELRKRIDLSEARITLTEKCLAVLVYRKRGKPSVDRLLRLWLNGRWSITGIPEGANGILLAEGNPVNSGKSIRPRGLTRIASMLSVTTEGEGN